MINILKKIKNEFIIEQIKTSLLEYIKINNLENTILENIQIIKTIIGDVFSKFDYEGIEPIDNNPYGDYEERIYYTADNVYLNNQLITQINENNGHYRIYEDEYYYRIHRNNQDKINISEHPTLAKGNRINDLLRPEAKLYFPKSPEVRKQKYKIGEQLEKITECDLTQIIKTCNIKSIFIIGEFLGLSKEEILELPKLIQEEQFNLKIK